MGTAVQLGAVETPGLLLREIRPKDARALAAYMTRGDYQRYLAVRYATAADVQGFVARSLRRQVSPNRTLYHLAAELKATTGVVGDGFLMLSTSKLGEIGWGVHPELWRRGFGTEIGRALLAVGFEHLKLERIWGKVFAANQASHRVMEKIGMTRERLERDQHVGAGVRTDVQFYLLSAQDYFEAPY